MAKDYINYASMLGMTDSYSDEKLDSIIKEYTAEQIKAYSDNQDAAGRHDWFKRNVDGLNRMKKERRRIKIAKEFTLKSEHIKLLSILNFSLNSNSTLVGFIPDNRQIAKAFEIKAFDQDGNFLDEDDKRIDRLIEELPYAISEIIRKTILNK